MGIGLSGYRIAKDGFYPVIFVNFNAISESVIEKNTNLAYSYFHNLSALYGSDSSKLDLPESYLELRRAVLDSAVSDELILLELRKLVSLEEIEIVANRKIDATLKENKIVVEGVQNLYGLTLENFRNDVLMPQAYREILEGRMRLNGQDFDSWLAEARKKSKVIVLLPDFEWNGEKVVLKK